MKSIIVAILLLSSTAFAGVKYETTNIAVKSVSTEGAVIIVKVIYNEKIEKDVPICNSVMDYDLVHTLKTSVSQEKVKIVYVADENNEVECISDAVIVKK